MAEGRGREGWFRIAWGWEIMAALHCRMQGGEGVQGCVCWQGVSLAVLLSVRILVNVCIWWHAEA